MTEAQVRHDDAHQRGWRPLEERHGWARTGRSGTARAVVEETEDGYTAQVVDAADAEDRREPGATRRYWGPEAFESPADAIAAAEAHLDEASRRR